MRLLCNYGKYHPAFFVVFEAEGTTVEADDLAGDGETEMPEPSTRKGEMPDVMFFSSTYENADVVKSN